MRFRKLLAELSEGEPHEDELETEKDDTTAPTKQNRNEKSTRDAEDALTPTGHAAGDTGQRGEESPLAKRLKRAAQNAAAGAENELPPTGHAARDAGQHGEDPQPAKRPKQNGENEGETSSATPNNISVLSEEALADMVKLMKKWEPKMMPMHCPPHLRRLAL